MTSNFGHLSVTRGNSTSDGFPRVTSVRIRHPGEFPHVVYSRSTGVPAPEVILDLSLDNLPQPAPPLARSAAPTAAPSQCMHKMDHFPVSDVRNTCTICVIRHSWESVTHGNFRKIDHFPVGDGFPWVTDNTSTVMVLNRHFQIPASRPDAAVLLPADEIPD